uniref:E1B 55K protein n=1 Tax=Cardioderma bat adenovirus TaxID=3141913 RepID=A0AAU7E1F0_9ADEN
MSFSGARSFLLSHPNEELDFENILSFAFAPGDDWERCISEHGKISLCPSAVYRIEQPVRVSSPVYIIGNGAKIVLAEGLSYGFFLHPYEPLKINGMSRAVISEVVFEKEGECKAIPIVSKSPVLVTGCTFLGIYNWCVLSWVGVEVRGCHFTGCTGGVKGSYSPERTIVKDCVFEKAMCAVYNWHKITVKRCLFADNVCSLLLKGTGAVSYCTFNQTGHFPYCVNGLEVDACVCSNGHVWPLGNIHITSRDGVPWPALEHCVFSRVRIYAGNRSSVLTCRRCTFSASTVCISQASVRRLCLYSANDSSLTVKAIQRFEHDASETRMCVSCEQLHPCSRLVTTQTTAVSRANRMTRSFDTLEFSSDDE